MAGDSGDDFDNADDQLAHRRYVTVIVRLVLDRADRMVQGELVELDGTSVGRFATCSGLARAMHGWLARPRGGAPS